MNTQPQNENPSTGSSVTLHELELSDKRPENDSISSSQDTSEEKPVSKEPLSEVTWNGDSDPENPHNWPKWKKWYYCLPGYRLISRYVTLTVSVAILAANFGTSIISPGLQNIAREFGVSIEVGILAISLYLIGFGNHSQAHCLSQRPVRYLRLPYRKNMGGINYTSHS